MMLSLRNDAKRSASQTTPKTFHSAPSNEKKKIEKQLHKMNHVRSLAREEISRRNITDLKEKKRIFNKHLNEFNEKDEYEQDEILQSSRRDEQALYDRWDANEDARPRSI